MKNVLVSVIIPIYNVAGYLRKCLPTVLGQTYQNLEILLIDDGSTDDSLKICQEYAEKDSRVKVFHQENRGVSFARNSGIDNSSGRYLAFVDGDDILAPFYIERLMGAIDGKVMSRCLHEQVIGEEFFFAEDYEDYKEISSIECAKRLLTGKFPISVWGCIFNKHNIGDLRFSEGISFSEDKHFLFRYLIENREGSVAFTNQKMYGHCVRPDSATKSRWSSSKDTIWVADDIHKLVIKKTPELQELSQQNRIKTRFGLLKGIVKKGNNDDLYNEIKEDIFILGMPPAANLQMKLEYLALKLGMYKAVINLYSFFMSEGARNRRNEKSTRQ